MQAKNSTKKNVPRKYKQKISKQLKKLHKSTGDLTTRHDQPPVPAAIEKMTEDDGDSGLAGDCSRSSCSSGQSWELASWRGDLSMSWQSLGSLSSFLVNAGGEGAPAGAAGIDHPPLPYERQQSSPGNIGPRNTWYKFKCNAGFKSNPEMGASGRKVKVTDFGP